MPLSKIEAASLSREQIEAGVVELVTQTSEVIRYLTPFATIAGTAAVINQERTLPEAHFYEVGDTWREGVGSYQQLVVALRQLGGDVEFDQFLEQTYSTPNQIRAILIASKAKALAYTFDQTFFDGDTQRDPKSFDGLEKLTRDTPYELRLGTNGGALTLARMDELIDAIKPGKPDVIFLSRRSRRALKALRRSSGIVIETSVNQFGQQVDLYDGIPLVVDDFIHDTYAYGSSGPVCSRLYAVQFGHGRGIVGYQSGGITVEEIGPLESKNAHKWRIKWYATIANTRPGGVVMLSGILP